MNVDHIYYEDALKIYNNWELDDWSITKEMYKHIIDILPFGKNILELGSGKSTEILSNFYNLISLEDNIDYIKKFKNTEMIHVPLKDYDFLEFKNEKTWYDIDVLKNHNIKNRIYDIIIVDGPCADRAGFYEFLDLFNLSSHLKYIFFDDTMSSHIKLAEKVAEKLNKKLETVQCSVNPKVVWWFNGKKYSFIEM